LVPLATGLPALQGPKSSELLNEFEHYGCKNAQLNIIKELSPECKKFVCNIGTFHDFAPPCECKICYKIIYIIQT
jgi:hypothetical protein